jgi:hypothetical protein
MRAVVYACVLGAVAVITPAAIRAQVQPARAVMVRVTDTTGDSLAAAKVELTTTVNGSAKIAQTNSAGIAMFVDPGGTGEYVITVSALQFRSARRRVVNSGGASRLIVHFVLFVDSTQQLARVKVFATRREIEKRFIFALPPGNIESVSEGTNATAPPVLSSLEDQLRSNLLFDALGGSALGQLGSQTQLNGMLFSGRALPRNAPVVVRGTVADYDASVSGFSNTRITADIARAGEYVSRSGTLVYSAVPQAAAVGATRDGPVNTAVIADGGGTTLFRREKFGLAWGIRGVLETEPSTSLESADPHFLTQNGVTLRARDEIARVSTQRGFRNSGALPASFGNRAALNAIGRLDFDRRRTRVNGMIGTIAIDATRPRLFDPFSSSSLARSDQSIDATLVHMFEAEGSASRAVWRARTGLTVGSVRSGANGESDATLLRVVPIFENNVATGAPVLTLGGSVPRVRRNHFTIEHQLEREQRIGSTYAHQVKVFAQARLQYLASSTAGILSTVDFPTLSAFTRADDAVVRIITVSDASASAGRFSGGVNDLWRITPRLQLSTGARIDFQQLQRDNVSLAIRNRLLEVSPRLGLTWAFAAPNESPGFVTTNLLRRQTIPPGTLRIGVGLFSADYTAADAVEPSGRRALDRSISCRLAGGRDGLADASVDALTAARLEAACISGARARVLSGTSDLDRNFDPTRALRSTIGMTNRFRAFDVNLDAILTRTLRQPRVFDLAVPERPYGYVGVDQRPFFGILDSIDSPSGQLRTGRTVGTDNVSRAVKLASDLSSESQRYVVSVSTRNDGSRRWPTKVGYAWSRAVSEQGGWDGSTAGSPWIVERASSATERRHQIQVDVAHTFGRIDVALWLRTSSGVPFSPLIAGDVNGDGRGSNDRFGVADIADFRNFVTLDFIGAGSPRFARTCLTRVASSPHANICRGPWSVRSAFTAKFDFGSRDHFPQAHVQLSVENPLSLAGRRMREASGLASIDPFVAQVRGFDRVTQRFILATNPNFGRRLALPGAASGSALFTVSVQLPLSPPIRAQQVDRWFLRRGLGSAALPVDSMAALLSRNVPDIIGGVLELEEELGLASEQRVAIMQIRDSLRAALSDSWFRFATQMHTESRSLTRVELMQRVQGATDAAWELSRLSARALAPLLSSLQVSMLDGSVVRLMRAKPPVRMNVIYY